MDVGKRMNMMKVDVRQLIPEARLFVPKKDYSTGTTMSHLTKGIYRLLHSGLYYYYYPYILLNKEKNLPDRIGSQNRVSLFNC